VKRKTIKERATVINEIGRAIERTMDGGEWNDGSFPEEPVPVIGMDFDEEGMDDIPDEQPEETDAERNNRLLHEKLIAAAMSNLPRTSRRVQAQFTKKRAKKVSSKERRKRQKQSRNGKRK